MDRVGKISEQASKAALVESQDVNRSPGTGWPRITDVFGTVMQKGRLQANRVVVSPTYMFQTLVAQSLITMSKSTRRASLG